MQAIAKKVKRVDGGEGKGGHGPQHPLRHGNAELLFSRAKEVV